jgi:hypothetical protein
MRTAGWCVAVLTVCGVSRADVLSDWTDLAVQTSVANKQPPFVQTRTLAMVHLAVFEALDAIDHRYQPYRSPLPPNPGASPEAAAATAAHDVLLAVFPDQAAGLEDALQKSLGATAGGKAREGGVALGKQAAAAVVALRSSDGFPPPSTYRPFTSAGVYVPTTMPAGFGWGKLAPWCIESGSQFRPGPPTSLQSAEWARDYNEIKSLGGKGSTARSAAQTEAARFWEATGTGAYKEIIRSALDPKVPPVRNARLLALTSMALADSYIAVFDAKYAYNFWRPVTAIRNADLDGNEATALDASWIPLIDTPMHPEYPCAHCINSGAVGTVLERELGSKLPVLHGTSATLPGVTHQWKSVQELLDEVANARIWGGVHYRNSAVVGTAMGRRVGELAVERCLRPVK